MKEYICNTTCKGVKFYGDNYNDVMDLLNYIDEQICAVSYNLNLNCIDRELTLTIGTHPLDSSLEFTICEGDYVLIDTFAYGNIRVIPGDIFDKNYKEV